MTTIEDFRIEYMRLAEMLHQQRDELKVKIHLANMEIRDEWDELEKKLEHMKAKGKQITEVTGNSAEDINQSAVELGHEIKKGYERLKQLL